MINPFSKGDYTQEVQRVINLGWVAPNWPDFTKFKDSTLQAPPYVSFPTEAYEIDSENKDLETFWANIRAMTIHKLLTEFEIECIWEIGSGDGSAAIPLTVLGIKVICVEPILAGAEYTAGFGIQTYCTTLEKLNLPNQSINSVGIFDVLEHIEHPVEFLSSLNKFLDKTGKIIVSVPMYMNLFSDFDESIGHYRRYSEKLLVNQLAQAGFVILKKKYLFSYLIIPAFVLRRVPYLLGKRRNYTKLHEGMNNQLSFAKYIKGVIKLLAKFEEKIDLPLGLSLIVIAEKSEV